MGSGIMGKKRKKTALILGANGQDGSYIIDILLEKGYEVHGIVRRHSNGIYENIKHLEDRINLYYGDLLDGGSLFEIISKVQPDEIYNEADQDHAGVSFQMPCYNYQVTGMAVGTLIEIVRHINKDIKIFQPISSNIWGGTTEYPQTENTSPVPLSPYACAKAFALHLARYYRQVHGMFVCTAIFYNHESPRRKEDYVTQKIIQAVKRIKQGIQNELKLGDMTAKIDWGYAKEYMEAAWTIMQLEKSDDYIIATGEVHSVEEWAKETFEQAGLDYKQYIKTDKALLRPSQNVVLCGNYAKAKKAFGFEPKVKFKELINIMYENIISS